MNDKMCWFEYPVGFYKKGEICTQIFPGRTLATRKVAKALIIQILIKLPCYGNWKVG